MAAACTRTPGVRSSNQSPRPARQPIFRSIRVDTNAATFSVGSVVCVDTEGLDQFGNRIEHGPYVWRSSDAATVRVSSSGTIQYVKRGTAVIMVIADVSAQSFIAIG